MDASQAVGVSCLAKEWQSGNRSAGDQLFRLVERELRVIAAAKLRREPNSSLSTGDLINEAMIRLSQLGSIEWRGRSHLVALAATIMRQVLLDQARQRLAGKRRGDRVTLCTDIAEPARPLDVIDLEDALEDLMRIDPQRVRIVEMRFYGGMSMADIGEVLDLSEATVKRRWAATRAWLYQQLRD